MRKPFIVLMIILMLAMAYSSADAAPRRPATTGSMKISVINLKYPMQKLWVEHAWWTRCLIVSKLANLNDQQAVLTRLLHNQEDLGNIIKPYYGVEAGNELTALLKDHNMFAGKLIEAAKQGNNAEVIQINKEWVKNADQIVAFLSKANPYWSKRMLTEMFYTHLNLTVTEVQDRLKENWLGDIRTADTNEEHLIHMGDFLTDGIVKQFPDKFK